jgi:hypothetical protein
MNARDTVRREGLRRTAQMAFASETRQPTVDPLTLQEETRRKANVAKTAALRELRLARDATAERRRTSERSTLP